MVVLRFPPTTTREEIAEIFEALDELKAKIAGIDDITSGAYDSPEGLNQGFTHGFCVTFASEEARNAYLVHPDHEVVKQMIVRQLANGVNDVVAFDFKVCNRFRY